MLQIEKQELNRTDAPNGNIGFDVLNTNRNRNVTNAPNIKRIDAPNRNRVDAPNRNRIDAPNGNNGFDVSNTSRKEM